MKAGYYLITLTAGGGTENIPVRNPYSHILMIGSATLTSGWTVQITGTPVAGMAFKIMYRATMDFNGQTLTIFGKSIPSYLQALPFDVDVVYDGSAWKVSVKAATIEAESITGASLVDDTIDAETKVQDGTLTFEKIEELLEGEMIIGNSSDIAAAVFFGGDAKIPIGDGTTLNSVAISGHIAIDNAGAVTIQDGVITEEMLAFDPAGYMRTIEFTLTTAQVNSLNTSPVAFLDALGASYAISIIGALVEYTFDTSAFAWAGNLQITEDLGGAVIFEILEADLESGSNKIWWVPSLQHTVTKNKQLVAQAETSDPTGGDTDSEYHIKLYYIPHSL